MAKMPVAVLIDGENVAASHIAAIMQTAERIGEPMARYVVGGVDKDRAGPRARTPLSDFLRQGQEFG